MRSLAPRFLAALLAPALSFSLAACGDDTVTGTPVDDTIREATFNSNSPAYVTLTDGPLAAIVADPAASTAWDLALNTTAVTTNVGAGSIEAYESVAPLLVWKKLLRTDSGGAGTYRGGLGQVVEIEVRTDRPVRLSLLSDRHQHPPYGGR